MIQVNQSVKHRKFGTGTVRQIRTQQPIQTALVEWDTHRVSEPWAEHSEAYSWVYLRSLAPDGPAQKRSGSHT
jgi:hypothetical protein